MAVTAKFQADFTSFLQAVDQADVKLADFGRGANKVEGSLNRMVDNFSGRKLIQEASLMTIAVEKAGGVSALTARELETVGNKAAEAAEKMRKLGYDVPQGMQRLADSTNNATAAGTGFSGALTTMTGLLGTFGITLGVSTLIGFVKSTLDSADALVKLHDKTGIGVEGLQRFQIAGDDAGNTIDDITGAITKMEDKLVSGDVSAVAAVERLGLNFQDLKSMSPEDQFIAISDAIRTIDDPAKQVNIAIDLFGKQGASVLPTLKRGFDDLKDSSVGMSKETVKALDDAGDAIARFGRQARGAGGTALAWLITHFAVADDSVETFNKQLAEMTTTADKALPHLAAMVPPSLPKDLKDLERDLTDSAHEQMKAAAEAKKHAEELAKLTGEVHKLEGGLFLIPESLGKIGRSFDEIKLGKVADEIGKVEQNAHIANFGFEGMTESLKKVGTEVVATQNELHGFAAFDFTGPVNQKLQSIAKTMTDVLKSVPQTIANAFTGGGGLMGAVQSIGSQAASALGEHLGKGISALGKVGGPLGAAIGSLAGPLIGFFAKVFSGGAEHLVNPIREAFVQLHGGLGALNAQAAAAGVTLKALLDAKTPEAYKKAIDDLTAAFDFQDKAMATLDETVKKYGFTIEELGPALQRQNMGKQAQEIFKDWSVLNAAGIDTVAIAGRMSDSVNAYVKQAIAMGIEVPAAMKPMLQTMIDQGQLTDAAGNKITDLNDSGITFTQTMAEGFKSVVDEVKHLADAITGNLGTAIKNIPAHITTDVDVNLNGRWHIPDMPREFAAEGGLVTASGIQRFGMGGNVLPFTPRGTDTVPAMLTPGERVLTVKQNRAYESGMAGGDVTAVVSELRAIRRDLKTEVARSVRDAVQKVSRR